VNEASAHRLYVERRAALDPELRLQQARRARKDVVGRRGGHDDEVDIGSSQASRLQRLLGSFERKVARGLLLVGDVAARDPGALADPRIARLEAAREFLVVHHPRRQVAPRANDPGVNHCTPAGAGISPIFAAMRAGTSFSTSSSARSSACPNAYSLAEPWLSMA